MVKFALLVRLEAKLGKEAVVANFLEGALTLANQETTTPVWFALRIGPASIIFCKMRLTDLYVVVMIMRPSVGSAQCLVLRHV